MTEKYPTTAFSAGVFTGSGSVAASGSDTFMSTDPERNIEYWEVQSKLRITRLLGAERLRQAAYWLKTSGILHFHNLPTDPSPPDTPYDGVGTHEGIETTIANVLGIVRALGLRSFSYRSENDGRIIRHVAPRRGAEHEASSQGWSRALDWHVDGAYRSVCGSGATDMAPAPRFIVWGVVYDRPQVPITYTRLGDVLRLISGSDLFELMQPQFDIMSPDSFREQTVSENQPIVVRSDSGGYFSRFNGSKVWARSDAGQAALERLKIALKCDSAANRSSLERGDVIILDNWAMLHKRPEFTPEWAGKDRWLVRVYAMKEENFKKISRNGEERCFS